MAQGAGRDGAEGMGELEILRLMMAASRDALYAVELPEVRMIQASPALPRLLGLPQNFLERGFDFRQYMDHVHPDDRRRVQGVMERILASRSDWELPENPARYRTGPPGGPWRHMEDHYRVLRAPDGAPRLLIGNSRDATGETAARAALRQSEESFRTLAENSPDIYFSMRVPQMRYEYISARVQELHGIAPETFYEDPGVFLTCVAPQWRERMLLWREQMARGEVRESYAFEVLDRHGRTRWIEQRTVLVPAPDGDGMLLLGVAQDKTEERDAREAMRQSEERYRLLAEGWTDQVVMRISLRTMRHEYVSPSAERMFGYAPRRFYEGDPEVMAAVAPEWREQVAEWMREAAGGTLQPEYEYEILDAWGRRRWVRQRGVLLPGDDGRPIAVQFLMIDVTEQKRLEEALRRSQAFLEHVIEQSPVSMWISDENGTLLRTNRALRERLRIRDEEVVGRFNIFEDEQVREQGHMPAIRRVFEQGGSARFELLYDTSRTRGLELAEHASGVLDFTVSAVRGAEGRTTNLIIQHVDIGEQKRAEEELRQKDALLSAMLRNLPFDFWARDTQGRVLMQSDESVRLWGDLSAQGEAHIHEDTRTAWRETDNHVTERSPLSQERRLRLPGGEERIFQSVVGQIRDGETLLGLLGVNIDITGRKATEEELRATNERYALLVENVEDIIWELDARLRWTYLTPSAEKLTGHPLALLLARPFEQTFTPESLPVVERALALWTRAEPGSPEAVGSQSLEMEILRADGGAVPIEVLARPLRDASGNITGYCGTARDISQRKAAEEALQRNERRFSELIRNSSDSITILAEDGCQVFVSEAVERMLGFSPAELMGIPVIERMLHPDDQECVRQAFAAILRDGKGGAQYRHRHKKGHWVHLEAWGTNQLTNPDIRGVVINVRDITDRKLAEAALQRSERLFRKLLESMHEGVWAFDAHYRTIFANERLGAMLGYSLEELVRKTPWEITAPEHGTLVHGSLAERRAGIAGTTEYILLRKDGSRLLAQVTSSPLMDQEGRFEGQVCGIVDLTSRLRLEREVRRNQARLEALYELSRLTGATEAQIASFTLAQALTLSESGAGVLYFVGPDGRTLEPRALEGAGNAGLAGRPDLEGAHAWAAVVEDAGPVIREDGQGRRFLGVPALDGGRATAVLGLSGKATAYDDADVLQLSLLVDGMWRIVRARRDEASIRASLREKEALLREVHHRVKNNLQVVSSLLDMSGRRLSEPKARQAMAEVQAKVQAMSLIHILLYGAGDGQGIHLGEYVGALFRQLREVYGGAGLTLSAWLHLDGLVLGLDQAVPLGLALNEALANVFKHATGGREGQGVEVRADRGADGMVALTVRDQGPGLPPGLDPESSPGLGMRLMRGLVVHQLGGELAIENAPEGGVVVRLRFRPSGEHAPVR